MHKGQSKIIVIAIFQEGAQHLDPAAPVDDDIISVPA